MLLPALAEPELGAVVVGRYDEGSFLPSVKPEEQGVLWLNFEITISYQLREAEFVIKIASRCMWWNFRSDEPHGKHFLNFGNIT